MVVSFRPVAASLLCALLAFAQQVLDNDEILKLVKAGLSDEIIVGMVKNQPGRYSTSADEVITLKNAGVSNAVISAMIEKGASSALPNATPVPLVRDTPEPLILHDGTPVRLRLSRNLSSADAKTGDTVDFEVLEDLTVDGALIIARGATAIGTVTLAQAKRRMARGGKLDVEIDYVRLVNGDKVALRAVKENRGGGHTGAMTGAMVATAIVVWPAAPSFYSCMGKTPPCPRVQKSRHT